jgi:hypothetical protein
MQPDIALLSAIVICLALIVLVALVAGFSLALVMLESMVSRPKPPYDVNH